MKFNIVEKTDVLRWWNSPDRPSTKELNKSYEVYREDELTYVVQRKDNYPHKWQAYDNDGEKVDTPDQYRNDLFERLEIIEENKYV